MSFIFKVFLGRTTNRMDFSIKNLTVFFVVIFCCPGSARCQNKDTCKNIGLEKESKDGFWHSLYVHCKASCNDERWRHLIYFYFVGRWWYACSSETAKGHWANSAEEADRICWARWYRHGKLPDADLNFSKASSDTLHLVSLCELQIHTNQPGTNICPTCIKKNKLAAYKASICLRLQDL